jgi:hypothetical protein
MHADYTDEYFEIEQKMLSGMATKLNFQQQNHFISPVQLDLLYLKYLTGGHTELHKVSLIHYFKRFIYKLC